ncbi:MAG: hypothetical protein SVY15_07600 [Halobacteriota archaeon]|nr:hypothetical protein [Halobacteriota archaeon]MDY6958419.1 hypothetical protein [Halobacteriota archaeon]
MAIPTNIVLLIFMLGVGLISGVLMSIALGKKVTDTGGILGGLFVAFLMWVLTGGASYV